MTRIAADVLNDSVQVFCVTDDAVVGFLLPQVAGLFEFGGDVPGRHGLHAADQVFQVVSVERADHQMTVIGHDHPAGEVISLVLKVMQPVAQIVGPARLAEVTGTVSLVQPGFGAASDLASVVFPVFLRTRFRMRVFPPRAQVFDFDELRFGQRIRQTKRDKVGGSVLPPVRQVPRVDADMFVGIQPPKSRRHVRRMAAPGRPAFRLIHHVFLPHVFSKTDGRGRPSYNHSREQRLPDAFTRNVRWPPSAVFFARERDEKQDGRGRPSYGDFDGDSGMRHLGDT